MYVRPPSVGFGLEVARFGTTPAPCTPPARRKPTSPSLVAAPAEKMTRCSEQGEVGVGRVVVLLQAPFPDHGEDAAAVHGTAAGGVGEPEVLPDVRQAPVARRASGMVSASRNVDAS